MHKRRRAEAPRMGWKKLNSKVYGKNGKKHKLWDDQYMVEAMDAVKSGRLRVNKAAEEYNVSWTTLKDKAQLKIRTRSILDT